MIAIQINEIGPLTAALLKGDMFDHFLLKEATIRQACDFQIDGTLSDTYYSEDEKEALHLSGLSYIPYARVRPLCLELLKGRRKPESFRFVFLLSPQNQANTIERAGTSFTPEDISGMFLNLNYKNGELTCTTGISYRIFSMDKSLENEWDRLVLIFFRKHGIALTKGTG